MKSRLLSLALLLSCLSMKAQENYKPIEQDVLYEENSYEAKKSDELKTNLFTLYSKKSKPVLVVRSHRKQDVTIFIYDASGALVYEGILKHHEKNRIEVATKGTYSYAIVDGSKTVEQGKLILK